MRLCLRKPSPARKAVPNRAANLSSFESFTQAQARVNCVHEFGYIEVCYRLVAKGLYQRRRLNKFMMHISDNNKEAGRLKFDAQGMHYMCCVSRGTKFAWCD